MKSQAMPELMRRSVESFLTQLTETLDPLEAIQITNLTMNLMNTVYVMGLHDGQVTDHTVAR
ncbi:hypothetical protein [Candidatus Cyanaurora vandensis]|uniref:hypothetical protein n=1 Tax=Candidatus Cyanaurora vandensis TaxID=2714958 RepID=UPI00257C175A|nr:hypothetical protein [Candidatus Cyanaurora vandensis]